MLFRCQEHPVFNSSLTMQGHERRTWSAQTREDVYNRKRDVEI